MGPGERCLLVALLVGSCGLTHLAPVAQGAEPVLGRKVFPIVIRVERYKTMPAGTEAKQLAALIEKSLGEAGYEVLGRDVEGPLLGILDDHKIAVDEVSRLALTVEGDLHLAFRGALAPAATGQSTDYALSASIYEPTTARQVAAKAIVVHSATQVREQDLPRLLEEAVGQLMPALLASLARELKEQATIGSHYSVMFRGLPKNGEQKMNLALNRVCASVELSAGTAQLSVFHVHCDLDRAPLVEAIQQAMAKQPDWPVAQVLTPQTQLVVVLLK